MDDAAMKSSRSGIAIATPMAYIKFLGFIFGDEELAFLRDLMERELGYG
jgi:hypothetical protein